MKSTYERPSDAARYDRARDLSAETKTQLMVELKASIAIPITHVVDLGCGTGRFTASLAQAFGSSVTGVEPSEAMLEVARQTHGRSAAITLLPGRAEAIPLEDDSASLVFMSQVYHHLPDPAAALAEIARVLEPGGYVAIRNATRETNDSVNLPWLRFFPDAVRTETARTPTHQGLLEAVADAGFSLVRATVLKQLFAGSPTEYAEKIGHRGLSALVILEDEKIDSGMAELRAWTAEQPAAPLYEPLELFIFRKGAARGDPSRS